MDYTGWREGHSWVLGVFKGVFGGGLGGLFYPYKERFAALEVLYDTRFGFKHYIMVHLANVY